MWSEADAFFTLEINCRSLSQFQCLHHCSFSLSGSWTVFKSCPSPFHSAVTIAKWYWREASWPCFHFRFCMASRKKFLTMFYKQLGCGEHSQTLVPLYVTQTIGEIMLLMKCSSVERFKEHWQASIQEEHIAKHSNVISAFLLATSLMQNKRKVWFKLFQNPDHQALN